MRIDTATAKKLVKNYKENHLATLNASCPSLPRTAAQPQAQDAFCAWFSLEEINGFVNAATVAGANGVRFYFGEYSSDIVAAAVAQLEALIQQDPTNIMLRERLANISQCNGLQTLVMIPTKRDTINNLNSDFNLINGSSTFSMPGELTAEDHSTLVPPPYGATGATSGIFFMDSVNVPAENAIPVILANNNP